jgi:hypothetical protein
MAPVVSPKPLTLALPEVAFPEVAATHLAARVDGMNVGVGEAGQQGAAVQIHHVHAGQAAWPGNLRGRPDRGDGAAANPHAGAFGQEPAAVEHGAVPEDELVTGHDRLLPPPGIRCRET